MLFLACMSVQPPQAAFLAPHALLALEGLAPGKQCLQRQLKTWLPSNDSML